MIYPTRLTVVAAAATAPVALVIGLLYPQLWLGGLGLLALLLGLCAVDALAGAAPGDGRALLEAPGAVGVGEHTTLRVDTSFARSPPAFAEVALGVAGPVEAPAGWRASARVQHGSGSADIVLHMPRRGSARVESVWARWPGPLGLVWKQRQLDLDHVIRITPDIRPVREKSAQLVNREATHGQVPQLKVGEGAEFEALTDYRPGMDRRAIDWKQSARHTALIAKEFRTERNNPIVVALDTGRTMCELVGGIARLDRAVTAALLTAFVALKDGDRVGFFAFDSRPRAASKPIGGERAFSLLQRFAAGVEYGGHETNYTLGIATLGGMLSRRTLIIVFTEFADTVSADLMLGAIRALLKRHLVLFVVLRDEELETFPATHPVDAADIARAVTAASLLRERRLVLTRLRHMGVHVIEAAADAAGPALVNAYLDLKRRDLL